MNSSIERVGEAPFDRFKMKALCQRLGDTSPVARFRQHRHLDSVFRLMKRPFKCNTLSLDMLEICKFCLILEICPMAQNVVREKYFYLCPNHALSGKMTSHRKREVENWQQISQFLG